MSEKAKRGRPKTLNTSDVVDVAMHAYWQDGPENVSLNSVVKRAGVAKPSIYREFGNEDGLTKAALAHYAECVLTNVIALLTSDASFHDRINAVAHLSAKDPLHENGCLFVKMRANQSALGENTRALIGQMDAMALAAFEQALREGLENGDWCGNIPVPQAAQYLHAQIGLALDMRARGEDPKDVIALALSIFSRPTDAPA